MACAEFCYFIKIMCCFPSILTQTQLSWEGKSMKQTSNGSLITLRILKYSCEHLLIPPSENLSPLLLRMQDAATSTSIRKTKDDLKNPREQSWKTVPRERWKTSLVRMLSHWCICLLKLLLRCLISNIPIGLSCIRDPSSLMNYSSVLII